MEERTSEIFKRLQKKQMEVVREAEEAEHKQEQLWREQGTTQFKSLLLLHHLALWLFYYAVSSAEDISNETWQVIK